MGVVFLGRERRGGRLAAVKALRPELAGDPAFVARFRREVEAARRVDSRHVARVLDADPAAERPWLATEHVDGATLAAEVARRGSLAGEGLVAFAAGVAEALAAIHTAGVVHRDLKPANVLLQHDPAAPGRLGVKVIDIGIAWAADATRNRSGLRLGTPSWMAPEQLRDQVAGPPADVFAWGAVVALAATGRHPFGGVPADAVAYRILHDRPVLDGVPEPVRYLVHSAWPATRPPAPPRPGWPPPWAPWPPPPSRPRPAAQPLSCPRPPSRPRRPGPGARGAAGSAACWPPPPCWPAWPPPPKWCWPPPAAPTTRPPPPPGRRSNTAPTTTRATRRSPRARSRRRRGRSRGVGRGGDPGPRRPVAAPADHATLGRGDPTPGGEVLGS
jgi:eukaryotic-like serine/threonine-protein kinase